MLSVGDSDDDDESVNEEAYSSPKNGMMIPLVREYVYVIRW